MITEQEQAAADKFLNSTEWKVERPQTLEIQTNSWEVAKLVMQAAFDKSEEAAKLAE